MSGTLIKKKKKTANWKMKSDYCWIELQGLSPAETVSNRQQYYTINRFLIFFSRVTTFSLQVSVRLHSKGHMIAVDRARHVVSICRGSEFLLGLWFYRSSAIVWKPDFVMKRHTTTCNCSNNTDQGNSVVLSFSQAQNYRTTWKPQKHVSPYKHQSRGSLNS